MPPPTSAIIVQIRGPGIIGPLVQIRGPEVNPDVLHSFADASAIAASNGGPVSLLLAQTWADVSGLTARWPNGGGAGWLVGTDITEASLAEALEAGDGELRILIAEQVNDIVALTASWAFH
jgi:hypothetical protein